MFAKLFSLVHLATKMNRLDFGVRRSKVKVTLSRQRCPALDSAVEIRFLSFLTFNIYSGCCFGSRKTQWRTQDFRMEGVEMPQAPRGWGVGEGYTLPTGGGSYAPSPENFSYFLFKIPYFDTF